MTTQEFIFKNKAMINRIVEKDEPLRIAALDTTARQATRIFVDGKNSDEGLIGQGAYNDNKPLYANPKITPGRKFSTGGNPNAKRKKTTPYKTKWFPSYRALKQAIGQPIDKVRLVFSGDLRSDFSNKGIAQVNKINQHAYDFGFKRADSIKKAAGLESKRGYGKIFSLSNKEQDSFFTIAGKEFLRITTI